MHGRTIKKNTSNYKIILDGGNKYETKTKYLYSLKAVDPNNIIMAISELKVPSIFPPR